MKVVRIGLSRLPLAAAISDGHHFERRRGGSRNRFFAEKKGEDETPRWALQRIARFSTDCALNCRVCQDFICSFSAFLQY